MLIQVYELTLPFICKYNYKLNWYEHVFNTRHLTQVNSEDLELNFKLFDLSCKYDIMEDFQNYMFYDLFFLAYENSNFNILLRYVVYLLSNQVESEQNIKQFWEKMIKKPHFETKKFLIV